MTPDKPVTDSTMSRQQQAKWFRKSLVIPTEHGSWSWLLVPYFVGVIVASQWNLASLLVLIGGFSAFLVRQPMTSWIRIRDGRGRKSDLTLAAGWTIGLSTVAFIAILGLLVMGQATLLWLLPPTAGIFILYLLAARQKRSSTRKLGMEVAGAAGLAAMAPAAYIASTANLNSVAWFLWLLMACQNTVGVMYVRLRLADTHRRAINRVNVMAYHVLVLLVVSVSAGAGWIPWLATLPFVAFLLRAVWATARERPVPNIKRFGFTEVGVEIAGGILIAAGWLV